MSVAIVGVAGAIGIAAVGATAYGAYSSSQSAERSSDAAVAMSQEDLAWQKERYDAAQSHLGAEGAQGEREFISALQQSEGALQTAGAQSDLYQQQSETYGMKAEEHEDVMAQQFESFLGGFQDMLSGNETALQDFTRRYGPIMDNVQQGIMDVSQQQLSATGREQLSFDMETLGGSFTQALASRNMGRSGVSVEGERRMAMDTAQQARAIDVNAYSQAAQLQGQGIQNLNSMQMMQQGYENQRLGILQSQGLAQQQVGQTYGNLAQNFYGASQNMFGQGFGAELGAQTNLSNLYGQMAGTRIGAENAFYSGTQAPNVAPAMSALQAQSAQQQADASGYMQTAGTLASNVDWGGMFTPTTPNISADNGVLY